MSFVDLVDKFKTKTGLSETESKDALELMVESIAVRLGETERRAFAGQLPQPLQDIALSVWPSKENSSIGLVEQFMQLQHVPKDWAKREIRAAWEILKETLAPTEASYLRKHLPKKTVVSLL